MLSSERPNIIRNAARNGFAVRNWIAATIENWQNEDNRVLSYFVQVNYTNVSLCFTLVDIERENQAQKMEIEREKEQKYRFRLKATVNEFQQLGKLYVKDSFSFRFF